jgi:hypothetical protein
MVTIRSVEVTGDLESCRFGPFDTSESVTTNRFQTFGELLAAERRVTKFVHNLSIIFNLNQLKAERAR